MKTFAFVSIFTWNYASDSIRVHVSVEIVKYACNTLLRDLVDYQVKLWNDFGRRLSAKHHTAVSRWRTDQQTLCGRRLSAAAGYYGSPTAKLASRWFGNEAKKSFKICCQVNLQSLFYIIQLNWLSELQFNQSEPFGNTCGVRNRQGAGTISRGRFIV